MTNEELRSNDVMVNNVIHSKYLQPNESVDEMFDRLIRRFSELESQQSDGISSQEIADNIRDFKYIIPGGSVISSLGTDALSSLSNCFVIGGEYAKDSFNSLTILEGQMKNIYKRRGGVGLDLSFLRPKGSKVNNSAKVSTGAVSFAESFSNTTGTVGQNGRRGALMLSLSIEHPDAQHFIEVKKDVNKINNANLSLRISDDFMHAVKEGSWFVQRFPLDLDISEFNKENYDYNEIKNVLIPYNEGYVKVVSAPELFRILTDSAWQSAEPGCLFWDTIKRESNGDAYSEFQTESTNPCFTYDTLVMTTRGPRKIGDLAREGHDVEVFSYDHGKIVVKTAYDIRKTGTKPIVRLRFLHDADFIIECTSNHKFLLANEEYREAGKLVTSDNADKIMTVIFHGTSAFNTVPMTVGSVESTEEVVDVFDMTVEDTHNFIVVKEDEHQTLGVVVHNCGEIPLSPYDSCRLIALNLSNFVSNPWGPNSGIDWKQLGKSIKVVTHLADDIVTEEINHLNRILEKVQQNMSSLDWQEVDLYRKLIQVGTNSRRCGIGILGLADMIAKLGLTYGSPEANNIAEKVMKYIAVNAYNCSLDLAESRGAFPKFDPDKSSGFLDRIKHEGVNTRNPRRNLSLLTIAPTGTISMISGVSSGMEPVFSIYYKRKVKNNSTGDWDHYNCIHPGFIEWYAYTARKSYTDAAKDLQEMTDRQIDKLINQSPYKDAVSHYIDYHDKIDLQSRLQSWVDHSISVTMNLPSSITKDEVHELYLTAHKRGCKGITIYRDGSRDPVVSFKSKSSTHTRPALLDAKVYRFRAGNTQWNAVIGLKDGNPYELFVWDTSKYAQIPADITEGKIVRRKSDTDEHSVYDFDFSNGSYPLGERSCITDISEIDSREHWVVSKLISGFLRNNVPVSEIVHSIEGLRWMNSNMKSWSKGICKSLKEYIKDGESGHEKCPECGTEMIYQSGCKSCPSCGHSHCSM